MRYVPLLLFLFSLVTGCSPTRRINRAIRQSPVLNNHLVGVSIYDPVRRKLVVQRHADQPFTPASNTKLFSFYAGLTLLSDTLPALRYVVRGDSLICWGTGNPLLLHPDGPDTAALAFLRRRPERLFFSAANYTGERFGPGWAWDDYNDPYSPEIAPLPLYGHIVRFTAPDRAPIFDVRPDFFADSVVRSTHPTVPASMQRDEHRNRFVRPAATRVFRQDVPFRTSPRLTVQLLTDTLHRPVTLLNRPLDPSAGVVFGHVPADSLYKRMLVESDNLLADHLLLLSADRLLNGRLDPRPVIRTVANSLPDSLRNSRWVDGSGLSRYNLFTPNELIGLLRAIAARVPQERLFALLPVGGRSGTLRGLPGSDKPFIFAKSGSMSGVYNLSGYLVTRRGRVLLFSVMNNNFTGSVAAVRQATGALLRDVHDWYR